MKNPSNTHPIGRAHADVVAERELGGWCVFVGGSIARGWSNPGSDVDAYVLGAPRDASVVVPN